MPSTPWVRPPGGPASGWAPRPLVRGSRPDLVVYRADPRMEPEVTAHPAMVILRGAVVGFGLAG